MTILLAICTILCVGYMLYSMSHGIPESLSATYYTLGKYGWVFQLVMFLLGALLFPVWSRFSSDKYVFLAFLACASLLFVAAAPAFRMELQGKVHYTAAAVCCVCAAWWQIAEGVWDTLLLFAFIALMLTLRDRSKWCWWLECAVTGSVYMNLIRETIVKI